LLETLLLGRLVTSPSFFVEKHPHPHPQHLPQPKLLGRVAVASATLATTTLVVVVALDVNVVVVRAIEPLIPLTIDVVADILLEDSS